MGPDFPPPLKQATAKGVACGTGAAVCWALGFVAARHGIDAGMSPLIIALHRYIWPGLALLPFVIANGLGDLGGVGWGRGFALVLFGGLPFTLLSNSGYLFVPLDHGGIIQPACAALGGMLLARLVLKEPLPPRRIAGAAFIILGLIVIGIEALRTMGAHGVGGDLMFVAAGCSFAAFGMLVRRWRVQAASATAITCVLSLIGVPLLLSRFNNMVAAGLFENVLQAVIQGALAGTVGTYLFTRAVVLLGASRAVLFPSLVPAFVLLIGFLALRVAPSISQLVGLAIIVVGFRLTQKG